MIVIPQVEITFLIKISEEFIFLTRDVNKEHCGIVICHLGSIRAAGETIN